VTPFLLEANQPERFYRGGAAIAAFRGEPWRGDFVPEDWVGSTTTLYGQNGTGLSVLSDGTLVRDAVAADPEAFLGPEHAERFGAEPALLVKLLDAGERLPVHCHPSRAFSRSHLGCPWGKTEAWVIVETRGEGSVYLGFQHDVERPTLDGWVARQETDRLLGALHRLPVGPGDAVLVPAGAPHAIGEGVFLVELQEPSDLSVLLEWEGFALDGSAEGHLGIGFDEALACVDRSGWGAERLARVRAGGRELRRGVEAVLPPDADPFFRAERLRPRPRASLEPSFAILVVVDGAGTLTTEHGGSLELRRGETILVPWCVGAATIEGDVEAIRCLPPLPEEAAE
jgi:mannose-6-phosphate isomerase